MRTKGQRNWLLIGGLAATAFFFVFALLIPNICDDWFALNAFRNAKETGRFINSIFQKRVCCRLLAIPLAPFRFLRAVAVAGTLLAILLLLWRMAKLKPLRGTGLAITFVLMMPPPIALFRQTYAWRAGFWNYVPPAALLLGYFLMIRPLFAGEPVRTSRRKAIGSLLLGLSTSLFCEHVTVYLLVAGLGIIVWHKLQTKKCSVATILFMIGVAGGAFIMFRSAGFQDDITNQSAYYAFPNSIGMLLYIVKQNYAAFSTYTLENAPLLHLMISGCSIGLLYRYKTESHAKERLKKVLYILLSALPFYFAIMVTGFNEATQTSSALLALSQLFGSEYLAIAFDLLAIALYAASVACVLLFFTDDLYTRSLGLLAIASALIISAPMLFVQPIPYRCFLVPYLLWALTALMLLGRLIGDAQEGSHFVERCLQPVAYAAAVAVAVSFLLIYGKCPEIDRARVTYIEQQMQLHATEIVLPQYGCSEYLHLSDDAIEFYYNYGSPDDIQYTYIPYEQWKAEYGQTLQD